MNREQIADCILENRIRALVFDGVDVELALVNQRRLLKKGFDHVQDESDKRR